MKKKTTTSTSFWCVKVEDSSSSQRRKQSILKKVWVELEANTVIYSRKNIHLGPHVRSAEKARKKSSGIIHNYTSKKPFSPGERG